MKFSSALVIVLTAYESVSSVKSNDDYFFTEKRTEHTPFYKKNKQNVIVDVRDTLIQFLDTSYSEDSFVK